MGVLDKVKAKPVKEGPIEARVGQRVTGKTTGLGYSAFLAQLFNENEQRDKPLNDATIVEILKKEFPGHLRKLKNKRKESKKDITILEDVRRYRREFNRGDIEDWEERDVVSLRYNDDGKPVNNTGRWMTHAYFCKLAAKYAPKDKRVKSPPKNLFREEG